MINGFRKSGSGFVITNVDIANIIVKEMLKPTSLDVGSNLFQLFFYQLVIEFCRILENSRNFFGVFASIYIETLDRSSREGKMLKTAMPARMDRRISSNML